MFKKGKPGTKIWNILTIRLRRLMSGKQTPSLIYNSVISNFTKKKSKRDNRIYFAYSPNTANKSDVLANTSAYNKLLRKKSDFNN